MIKLQRSDASDIYRLENWSIETNQPRTTASSYSDTSFCLESVTNIYFDIPVLSPEGFRYFVIASSSIFYSEVFRKIQCPMKNKPFRVFLGKLSFDFGLKKNTTELSVYDILSFAINTNTRSLSPSLPSPLFLPPSFSLLSLALPPPHHLSLTLSSTISLSLSSFLSVYPPLPFLLPLSHSFRIPAAGRKSIDTMHSSPPLFMSRHTGGLAHMLASSIHKLITLIRT